MSSATTASAEPTSLVDLLHQRGPFALFLDFDGVLAELAPTPDAVEVKPRVIAQLQTLNSTLDGALAVVSGRAMASLDELLAPLVLAVAADHGNARRTRDGALTLLNADAGPSVAALAAFLHAQFADDARIIVEPKPSAVAVHYRLAPERAEECVAIIAAAIADLPEFSLIAGKMVIEARAAGASKGVAVESFMHEQPFVGRTPIFIGDDLTDEDGFAAAQALGGLGIKVGQGETGARYRIGHTRDVPAVLDVLIRSQRPTN